MIGGSSPHEWSVAERLTQPQLDLFPDVDRLIVQLLHNREIRSRDEVDEFLARGAGTTGDPYLLTGMREAVDRVAEAVARSERIAVHGDFDADGLTATAVLVEALRALGARAEPYIPLREDGYGMAEPGVRKLAERGVDLIITVDCGISSAAEVALATRLGVDVIVTDHHRLTGDVPEALAVINPRQPGCRYPDQQLAGVGVAFKLVQALLEAIPLPADEERTPAEIEQSLTDLVAIGTIVDVAPLLGENRVLTIRGLEQIHRGDRPGLRELCRVSGFASGVVGAWEVAFAIGPRLNAAGRLGDAVDGYRLLVSDWGDAARLAEWLDAKNRERQELTERMIASARAALPSRPEDLDKVLMVAGSEYPLGILGLVAARLVEEYSRPAFVLGVDAKSGSARGSARSIAEFDLAAALGECSDLLARFGGHARAAGFAVAGENIEPLRARLLSLAEEQLADYVPRQTLRIDAELNLRGVTKRLSDEIQRLSPFGHGNPEPLFLTRGLRLLDSRVVGQSAPGHLRLALHDGLRRWPAIAFGMGGLAGTLSPTVDVAYHLEVDNWSGRPSLRLRVRGIRPA